MKVEGDGLGGATSNEVGDSGVMLIGGRLTLAGDPPENLSGFLVDSSRSSVTRQLQDQPGWQQASVILAGQCLNTLMIPDYTFVLRWEICKSL